MCSRSITPARASFGFATAAPTRRSLIPTGSPAVSHRMPGDLHPVAASLPPRVACNSRPATGRRGLGARRPLRRRAGNAPDQVDERRAVDGRDLAGQPEAASAIILSAHHLAPQTESAECTGNSAIRRASDAVPRAYTTGAPRQGWRACGCPVDSLGRGVRSPRRFSPAAAGPSGNRHGSCQCAHASRRSLRTKPLPKRRSPLLDSPMGGCRRGRDRAMCGRREIEDGSGEAVEMVTVLAGGTTTPDGISRVLPSSSMIRQP